MEGISKHNYSILLKDIKQAQAHSFWMEIFSMGRMRTVSKFTCNFNAIPIKIIAASFLEMDRLITIAI